MFCSVTEVSFPICALDAWVPGKSLESERRKITRDPVTPPWQLTEPLCSVEGLGIRVPLVKPGAETPSRRAGM